MSLTIHFILYLNQVTAIYCKDIVLNNTTEKYLKYKNIVDSLTTYTYFSHIALTSPCTTFSLTALL